MAERVHTFLGAYTPTTYEGAYPPYVNVAQVGSMIQITMRGSVKESGAPGDCAVVEVNNFHAHAIAEAILDAVRRFDTSRPVWVPRTPERAEP